MRGQKGITLVALIITIVVLLILAVVSINAITDDGVLDYATNAKNDWQDAQKAEDNSIENYTQKLQQYTSGLNN